MTNKTRCTLYALYLPILLQYYMYNVGTYNVHTHTHTH